MLGGLIVRRAHDAGRSVRVRTAGTRAGSGEVHLEAVSLLAERDVDLAHHTPARLSSDDLSADLILGVTREHARLVLALDREATPRTFTVREMVRRGTGRGARRSDETVPDWLERIGAGRRTSDLAGSSELDDLIDVTGSTSRTHAQLARELDGLAGRIVDLLWPTAS
jgi:protein-tyrosine-phosphatase